LKYGPPRPAPETPKSNEKRSDNLAVPKSPENPWTLSKRKPVSREVSDEDENGGSSKRPIDGGELSEFEDIDTASRKVAKVTSLSTPGQMSRGIFKNAADSLPTPDTSKKVIDIATTPRSRFSHRESPPPRLEHTINLKTERSSNLTETVISLIHSENIELKESTEIQIRHEIDMELDLNEAKALRNKKTISKLSTRIDELVDMVRLLGGDVAADDAIELSD
jgi:hypothetical protein